MNDLAVNGIESIEEKERERQKERERKKNRHVENQSNASVYLKMTDVLLPLWEEGGGREVRDTPFSRTILREEEQKKCTIGKISFSDVATSPQVDF